MLIYILIALAAAVLVFLIIVAIQPAEFLITRSANISAPAPTAFALVNDFHKWMSWSPWEGIDPALKRTYEGPPAGAGTIYSWSGNNKVGEGRMTLTESHPGDRILIELEFLRPFKATNITEFTFKPNGNQTTVTWNMSGRHNFISKAFCMFMNMDKKVGGDFEKGLAKMKSVAESGQN